MRHQNSLFGDDFPEVRAFIRQQLTIAAWGTPHTKRALGEAAVCNLLESLRLGLADTPTLHGLAVRGAIAVAAEELRRVRVRFRSLPSINAFYALVIPGEGGKHVYVQAPVPSMNRQQLQRVWKRMVGQRDRSGQVAEVLEALWSLETWERGANSVTEACKLAGAPLFVEVATDEAV